MSTSTPKPQKKDTRGNKALAQKSIAVYVCATQRGKGKDITKLYRFVDSVFDSEFKTDSSVGNYTKKLKRIAFYSLNDKDFTMHIYANPLKVNILQAKSYAMEIAILHKKEFADFIEYKNVAQTHVVNPSIVNKSSEIGNIMDSLDVLKSELDYMYKNRSIGTYKECAKKVKLWYWLLAPHIEDLDK
jgi:hypothetical protein